MMKCLSFIFVCISFGIVHAVEITPLAEERLTPEALARYAAPGEASRYVALETELLKPVSTLGPPALNLQLPVRSYPNGQAQTLVTAKEAWVSPDMLSVRGHIVHIENFKIDGTIESTLDAEEIVLDRTAMLAVAKGKVHGTYGEDILTGEGAWCDLKLEYVKILKHAQVITHRTNDADFSARGMF
ncbi:MAG: hypothetical protein RR982_00500 [Kiritimatiellia bacterium]